jgi:hypothetical protein
MLPTIDLGNDACIGRGEVDDAGWYRVLSPERPAIESARSQVLPGPFLSFRHLVTELSRARLRAVRKARHADEPVRCPLPTLPRLRRERGLDSKGRYFSVMRPSTFGLTVFLAAM